jgi:hypothetical protein
MEILAGYSLKERTKLHGNLDNFKQKGSVSQQLNFPSYNKLLFLSHFKLLSP